MIIRPYGDTTGDGMVQLSFTLPVPAGARGEGGRGAGLPGGHPARRAPAQHPGDVRGVPGGTARPAAPAARGRRAAVRRARRGRPRRGPDLQPGYHAPRGGQLPRPRANPGGPEGGGMSVGLSVTHRRYVPYAHAHYAGNLVDGAYALGLFGDVATEVCIRSDGDEGLFAGYSDVRFTAPIRAGDVVEVTAQVTRVGNRSRTLEFSCVVVCRSRPDKSASAAEVLDPPVVAVIATGTVVVP